MGRLASLRRPTASTLCLNREYIMELKDFVAETIVQISDGIEEAQKQLKEKGSETNVNPYMTKDNSGKWVTGGRRENVEVIEFDVAILANEGTETKAGIGITVASVLNLDAGGASNQTTGTESRIKFKVPAAFAMHKHESTE